MDMIVILAALAILLVLTLKKVPVTIAALLSVIFLAVFSRMPVLTTVTQDYLGGFAGFVQSAWLMLLLGTILSKVMDVTGAAASIARFIVGKLGVRMAIPAVVLAGGLLTYGGVSSFVSCFALYPITLAIFRKANLPRYLIPAAIGSGIFTWVNMLPGVPSVMNVIPGSFLGTTPMAAPIVGIISAIVALALTLLYLEYEVRKAKKKSVGFEADISTKEVLEKSDELEASGSLPHPILAILPVLAVAVVLNVFKADISIALLVGIVLCGALCYKNLSDIKGLITDGANSAAVMVITASAIVGIGSAIKAAPGFQDIVDFVLGFSESGGNPLIIFGIATTLLCGLNASGMSGLSTTLSVLAEPFMKMGVNAEIMHRIGVIAATGLDSLPHSGGIVAVLTISGVSYKDGYKYLFVTTVCITLIALAVALALGNIIYPIGV